MSLDLLMPPVLSSSLISTAKKRFAIRNNVRTVVGIGLSPKDRAVRTSFAETAWRTLAATQIVYANAIQKRNGMMIWRRMAV